MRYFGNLLDIVKAASAIQESTVAGKDATTRRSYAAAQTILRAAMEELEAEGFPCDRSEEGGKTHISLSTDNATYRVTFDVNVTEQTVEKEHTQMEPSSHGAQKSGVTMTADLKSMLLDVREKYVAQQKAVRELMDRPLPQPEPEHKEESTQSVGQAQVEDTGLEIQTEEDGLEVSTEQVSYGQVYRPVAIDADEKIQSESDHAPEITAESVQEDEADIEREVNEVLSSAPPTVDPSTQETSLADRLTEKSAVEHKQLANQMPPSQVEDNTETPTGETGDTPKEQKADSPLNIHAVTGSDLMSKLGGITTQPSEQPVTEEHKASVPDVSAPEEENPVDAPDTKLQTVQRTEDDGMVSMLASEITFYYFGVTILHTQTDTQNFAEIVVCPMNFEGAGDRLMAWVSDSTGINVCVGKDLDISVCGINATLLGHMEQGKFLCTLHDTGSIDGSPYEFDYMSELHGSGGSHIVVTDDGVSVHIVPILYRNLPDGKAGYAYVVDRDNGKIDTGYRYINDQAIFDYNGNQVEIIAFWQGGDADADVRVRTPAMRSRQNTAKEKRLYAGCAIL